MYKSRDYGYEQLSLVNFNTTCGMQLDPDNGWIQLAKQLPWRAWETLYEAMFTSSTGNAAKPSRVVIGSMILQQRMGFTDRELVDQIQQNPYYQYFIGLESFQHSAPFSRMLLVEWRKRADLQFITKVNDILCDAAPNAFTFRKRRGNTNRGILIATQICDATVAPQYIRFPQDTSLLNEARVKLETMIDFFCERYGLDKPRTCRKAAHKDYLAFARSKRPSAENSVMLSTRSWAMSTGISVISTVSCIKGMHRQKSISITSSQSMSYTGSSVTCLITTHIRLKTAL